MNITFFSIRYYNCQIKIINKKKNFCIYINRCNQYCNSNNPIYCCNCLYLIESDPNLNEELIFKQYCIKFLEENRKSLVITLSVRFVL